MIKKTLLLNSSYEVLAFITERRAFKLLCKEKVEIISTWDDTVNFGKIKIKHPAVLKLINYVKINHANTNFSRKVLIKRDKSCCQYCGKKLSASQITIDHVKPKAQGGTTSFVNCVVSCLLCNNKKADRTPEQANMKLLKKPTHPSFSAHYNTIDPNEYWHQDWDNFLIST